MSKAVENLERALNLAARIRPKAGGFPYFAEVLRKTGVSLNIWFLPACQALYMTKLGAVAQQLPPLTSDLAEVPEFDRKALILAIRMDQGGNTTFPEFLSASWRAGVVRFEVDFNTRTVSYFGCREDVYVEEYPPVDLFREY